MVVCRRCVLDQDLTDHADLGFLPVLVDRDAVEVLDDLPAHLMHLPDRNALCVLEKRGAALEPFLVAGLDGALLDLIGPHPVDALHEHVAEDTAKSHAHEEL